MHFNVFIEETVTFLGLLNFISPGCSITFLAQTENIIAQIQKFEQNIVGYKLRELVTEEVEANLMILTSV